MQQLTLKKNFQLSIFSNPLTESAKTTVNDFAPYHRGANKVSYQGGKVG